MDDADVVAAIAAGELDGLAAALDRYAAPLYDYCYSMAPSAAADAVHNTFVIAWCRLAGLRDPADVSRWLEAVAGNECFRQTLAGGTEPDEGPSPSKLPPSLRRQVLSACADQTPAGRAYRVSLTHRAGPFGPDGFPRAGRWRRGWAGRRRVTAVATVAVTAAAAAALITAVAFQPAGDTRHALASAPRLGRSGAGSALSGPGPTASGASLPTTPAQLASPSASRTPAQAGHGARGGMAGAPPTPGPGPGPGPGPTRAPAKAPPTPAAPMAAVSAVQGVLTAFPPKLVLNLDTGGSSAKTLVVTADGGPIANYTIAVPSGLLGNLTVSPSSGSLAEGGSASITVTAIGTSPFTATLTLYPGGQVVLVVVKAPHHVKGDDVEVGIELVKDGGERGQDGLASRR